MGTDIGLPKAVNSTEADPECAVRRRWWAGLLTCVVAVGWCWGSLWPLVFLLARGRLPTLPLIGEVSDGWPFYHLSHAVFSVLLAAYVVLGWPLWRVGRGIMRGDPFRAPDVDSCASRGSWLVVLRSAHPPFVWLLRAWLLATSQMRRRSAAS